MEEVVEVVPWVEEVVQWVAVEEEGRTRVTDRFVRHFVQGSLPNEDEVVIDPEADDPPEPLGDGQVDAGEIVTQQLALALDPYPRAPGSALTAEAGAAPAESPFRVLAALKTGQ